MSWPNGDKFTANFVETKLEGEGELQTEGMTYKGTLEDNDMTADLLCPDGTTFEVRRHKGNFAPVSFKRKKWATTAVIPNLSINKQTSNLAKLTD